MNKEENALALALEKRANKIGALDAYQNANSPYSAPKEILAKGGTIRRPARFSTNCDCYITKQTKNITKAFGKCRPRESANPLEARAARPRPQSSAPKQ